MLTTFVLTSYLAEFKRKGTFPNWLGRRLFSDLQMIISLVTSEMTMSGLHAVCMI